MTDVLDPARWEPMRHAAAADAQRVARDLLHAHGTTAVALPFSPPMRAAVLIGDPAVLASVLPGAGATKPGTLRQMMQVMTRLGLPTNYDPDRFAADFDGELQRLLRGVEAILDRRHVR